jgi:anti-sigma factor RsiW
MSESKLNHHPDDLTLDVYLDGELPTGEARGIEAHLESCSVCREHLQARRAFFELIVSSEEVSLKRDVSTYVLGSLQRSRLRLLAGVLSLEAIFAITLLAIFGPRMGARIAGFFEPEQITDSMLWLAEGVEWLDGRVEAALVAMADAVDLMPLSGFQGLPLLQLNWMHWVGLFVGILLLWVLINRVLMGSLEINRTRLS